MGRLGDGPLPVVTGSIAALEADGRRASVTFTHEAWASIYAAMDREFSDDQIVGWYHSHPGFGIFLSSHDRFIHDNFFSDSRQIAYVVDPHAGTEGVFHWRNGKLVALFEGPAGRRGTGGPHPPHRDLGPSPGAPAAAIQRRRWITVGIVLLAALALVIFVVGSGGTAGHHQTNVRDRAPAARSTARKGGRTDRVVSTNQSSARGGEADRPTSTSVSTRRSQGAGIAPSTKPLAAATSQSPPTSILAPGTHAAVTSTPTSSVPLPAPPSVSGGSANTQPRASRTSSGGASLTEGRNSSSTTGAQAP